MHNSFAHHPFRDLKHLLMQWWFTALVLAAILLFNFLPETTHQQYNLKHSPINEGAWWRLLSCHFLHLSLNHTLLNFAGYLFVVFSFRDEIPPPREILILIITALGVGLGIYYLNPDMYSYVGLSGAIYGVLIAYVIIGLNRTPLLSLGFLAFIIGKFIFEFVNGGTASQTEEFIGGKVATDSHLYGALTGFFPGVWFFIKDRKRLQREDTKRFVDQFKHPVVRDLAWAIHSPPLLDTQNSDCQTITHEQCIEFAADFRDTLTALDKAPEALVKFVAPENARLGVYFERLIAFWLSHQTRYSLISHNLKIEVEKRTLGEFDFIIKDNLENKTIHGETAVKFYLGTKNYDRANLWYGPGIKDRLDLKVNHLLEKQIRLSLHPQAKEFLQHQNINIDARALFVKGRLFYPAQARKPAALSPKILSANHLRSRWYQQNSLTELKSCSQLGVPVWQLWQHPRFHICEKDEWLTLNDLETTPSYNFEELKTRLKQHLKAQPVVVVIVLNKREHSRFFVVPNNWQSNTEAF